MLLRVPSEWALDGGQAFGCRPGRRAWPDLSRDRRRAFIHLVLERVVVHPGRRGYNRFDPDRFELVWRA